MYLTDQEHSALTLTKQLAEKMEKIVGPGNSHKGDLAEFAIHLHAIQNMILAQAASRAYPSRYRLLGD